LTSFPPLRRQLPYHYYSSPGKMFAYRMNAPDFEAFLFYPRPLLWLDQSPYSWLFRNPHPFFSNYCNVRTCFFPLVSPHCVQGWQCAPLFLRPLRHSSLPWETADIPRSLPPGRSPLWVRFFGRLLRLGTIDVFSFRFSLRPDACLFFSFFGGNGLDWCVFFLLVVVVLRPTVFIVFH